MGTFEFKKKYVIKMVEKPHAIDANTSFQTIKLLAQEEFNFFHIGLVQVGLKPLKRLGLNMTIFLATRDARHLNFEALTWPVVLFT